MVCHPHGAGKVNTLDSGCIHLLVSTLYIIIQYDTVVQNAGDYEG